MFLKILQLKIARGEECLCHLRGEFDYFVDTEKQEDFFSSIFFFFLTASSGLWDLSSLTRD